MTHAALNEAETRAELIDPALKNAGWGVVDPSRIRREVIAPERLQGGSPAFAKRNHRNPARNAARVLCLPEKKRVKVKLADGKERAIQHTSAISFWSSDGKRMSAAEFVQRLYGDLPEWFADEERLREIWSNPGTRKKLLEGLEEKGYGLEQLREIGKMIEAENSDIYDVLALMAFNMPPISRSERVTAHKEQIYSQHNYQQHDFLEFVLEHYVARGITELDPDKLPQLIELKYHTVRDAVRELGPVGNIREVFVGFQRELY